MGLAIALEEIRDMLEDMKEKDLFHYVQKCIHNSIAEATDPLANSHSILDLVYAECTRRGKERLYDKAYETVCRGTKVCHLRQAR